MKPFDEAIRDRILIGDGAMGTMLQEGGLAARDCPESAVLARPELVLEIHERYREAGADIIETNSFGANRHKLAEYGLGGETERINREAARLARRAARGRAYVAGSVGPLGRPLEPIGDLPFLEAVEAFREQMRALAREGVDVFFLETLSDVREAKAALIAAREASGIPVVAHMTFEAGGRTLTGTPAEAAAVVLAAAGAAAVGANCSTGPAEMLPVVERMAAVVPCPLSVLPNAGLPELVDGRTVFRESPAEMAAFVERFALAGVAVIGGCCGTTPDHIRAMREALTRRRPAPREVPRRLRLASRTLLVEVGEGAGPLVVGERINLSVRRKAARAFIEGDTNLLRQEAVGQVAQGARVLDVNVGVSGEALGMGEVAEADLMGKAVRVVQRAVEVPLMIDSTNPDALEAGLRECEGRPIINSVPADRAKMPRILALARRYGAAIVVLPISEKGVPETAARRVRLASEVRASALRAGIAPEDILVDPLVMAVSADGDAAAVALETLRQLREKGHRTIMGLSNVSFGLPERGALNAAFLSMALGAGLDAVILNPGDEEVMRALAAGRVITAADAGARDFIARVRAAAAAAAAPPPAAKAAPEAIRERLSAAILAGDGDGVIPPVEEALAQGIPPIDINLTMIAPALEEVGARFERKEIYLPQMILAAETVQSAFARLRRAMKGEKMPSRGTLVMATVKGDVHDIGKNICCTVLENYGYTIRDLGRNVPAEVIAEEAAAAGADIVGLSALMTTTMRQMEVVIAEMRRRGMRQKVMVGGAVVTPAYARKIGADGTARNAGEIVRLVNRLMAEPAAPIRP
ncbi:MAG: homocysteine S-methyltransferase family protein [bacterium]|nr:homocysteine S-methyltransferase family protein [bacterium]